MPGAKIKNSSRPRMDWTWQARLDQLRKDGKLLQFGLSTVLLTLSLTALLSMLVIGILFGAAPLTLGPLGAYLGALSALKLGVIAFAGLATALAVFGLSLAYDSDVLWKQDESLQARSPKGVDAAALAGAAAPADAAVLAAALAGAADAAVLAAAPAGAAPAGAVTAVARAAAPAPAPTPSGDLTHSSAAARLFVHRLPTVSEGGDCGSAIPETTRRLSSS